MHFVCTNLIAIGTVITMKSKTVVILSAALVVVFLYSIWITGLYLTTRGKVSTQSLDNVENSLNNNNSTPSTSTIVEKSSDYTPTNESNSSQIEALINDSIENSGIEGEPESESETESDTIHLDTNSMDTTFIESDTISSISIQANESTLTELTENVYNYALSKAGGDWSVFLCRLDTFEQASSNNSAMQSASLIKLYIMGAVYDNYDRLCSQSSEIDNLLYQMITVSDNDSANTLVTLLGNGSAEEGKSVVNAYCAENGFSSTSMGRMLLEPAINGDNYTSVSDCGHFLIRVYNGEFEHSADMLNMLKQQTVTTKIPSGIPYNVTVANKTGELDLVQNDVAIVFSDTPYILCLMSQNQENYALPVQTIVDISSMVYNDIN